MIQAFGMTFSIKEEMIVKVLYKLRAASVVQLTFALYPEDTPEDFPNQKERVSSKSRNKQISRELKALEEKGVVEKWGSDKRSTKVRVKIGHKETTIEVIQVSGVYSLTEFGYRVAVSPYFLDIPIERSQGSGWKGDEGYFPYSLYIPPRKQMNHFRYGVDTYILLNKASNEYGIGFDLRDNRYSKISYVDPDRKTKNKMAELKPDGEFKLRYYETACKHFLLHETDSNYNEQTSITAHHNDTDSEKLSWLEIDMGGEDADELYKKLARYSKAYDYYSEGINRADLQLADNVFFITDINAASRYRTLLYAVVQGLGNWGTHLNLYVGNPSGINHLLASRCTEEALEQRFLHASIRYWSWKGNLPFDRTAGIEWNNELQRYDFTFYSAATDKGKATQRDELISELQSVMGYVPKFVLYKHPDSQKLFAFLFERYNGLETRPICRVYHFAANLKKIRYLSGVTDVVPVFYYDRMMPDVILSNLQIGSEEKLNDYSDASRSGNLKYVTEIGSLFEKAIWYCVSNDRWFNKDHHALSYAGNPLLGAINNRQ